ncbi:MAG: 23S rRNA (adenine(2503)-C(2))-methyltransferase RlmN [Bacteroidales bacterium]|jgi:23S rRNA (adenine2503-C2)-methyltransferase|nr:23S rRNA (adenine(2503)-C(2))-methyltransferase RlmN [Bacteroidales bacterium]
MYNFRNITLSHITKIIEDFGEKKFRATQINEWIWKKNISDFNQLSNIPENLIKFLQSNYFLDNLKIDFHISSKDRTTKCLFKTIDNLFLEGVLIPSDDRITACISSQIGCALNCDFCATGKLGFSRNLSIGEIYDEVFIINSLSISLFNKQLSNVVIMGMGEPLLNYENILAAINIITSNIGMNMSPQRITLSTAGIAPKIIQLADDNIKFNLSISLHSADNIIRSKIMPINNKYYLQDLSDAISYFYKKTNIRITYEYLLLNNINNSIDDAKKLAKFTKISPCKINLINYNSTEKSNYSKSEEEKTEKFKDFLESKNLIVTVRKSKGSDIAAACGQLIAQKNNLLI